MGNYVNLHKWRGPRDTVALDPATVEFRAQAQRGNSCRNCIFDRQWAGVCDKVAIEAAKRGLPKCDEGHVYTAVERDPRQLAIPA